MVGGASSRRRGRSCASRESKPRARGTQEQARVLYRPRVGGMERRSGRRLTMAQDMLKRQWESLKGRVRQRWSRFTDDDLTEIDGEREALMGKIQERLALAIDLGQIVVRE